MDSPTAIDLFAGAGGATQGLRQAGFKVVGGVENDHVAAQTYRVNQPDTQLWEADIRTVDTGEMRATLGIERGQLTLLKACPPCQGFSTLASGKTDEARNDLVLDVARFVKEFLPRTVLIENVPGLARDSRLQQLTSDLEPLGYVFRQYVVQAADLGVPQKRRRLIVFGVRNGSIELPEKFSELIPAGTDLTPITSGAALATILTGAVDSDPMNRHRSSSATVTARIAAIPVNGNRFDLPEDLQLKCHKALKKDGKSGAAASYGRVKASGPAPTMTTRCTTPSCGSFIHPTENRGLTLREAATFQTFPPDYKFAGDYGSVERQIGNAVPVKLAELLGKVGLQLAAA